jgi:hypothetical protein
MMPECSRQQPISKSRQPHRARYPLCFVTVTECRVAEICLGEVGYAGSAHWFQCVSAYDSAVAISLRAKVLPPKPLGMPERMSFEGEGPASGF